jgi:hypothetical protein
MRWVRTGLPLSIIAAGILIVIVTGASENGIEGGVLLVSAGMSVWLLNWFYRVGVKGDRDRVQEDAARAFFDEHGYWPDEDPAPGVATPARAPREDPHRRPPAEHGPRPPRPPRRNT